jgi:mono/diheme cytochrome c family protein
MRTKLRPIYSGILSLALIVAFGCSSKSRDSFSSDDRLPNGEELIGDGWPESFGLGRSARQAEIDSLSLAIPPSGKGLPPGEGLALRGKLVYAQKCSACHGPTGKEGPQDVLVATEPVFSGSARVSKGIGNYWPYSTTVFDYIRRAMPLNAPGSLSNQEVYDVTAWLLHQNGLIAEGFVLNSQTLPAVEMPAKIYFINDSRTGGANPVY